MGIRLSVSCLTVLRENPAPGVTLTLTILFTPAAMHTQGPAVSLAGRATGANSAEPPSASQFACAFQPGVRLEF